MYSKQVIIEDKERLKLWSIDVLATKASNFQSNIRIKKIEKDANCKSFEEILNMISRKGCIIEIKAEGIDEKKAVNELVDLIENQFEKEPQQYLFFLD